MGIINLFRDVFNPIIYLLPRKRIRSIYFLFYFMFSFKKFLNEASFFDQGDKRERDDGTSFVLRAPLYEIEQNKLNKLNNVRDLNDI